MPFSDAYRTIQLQLVAASNFVGPLWIGDPELSYAAFLPWQDLEQSWEGKVVPIQLHEASKATQSKTRQQRVARHCDKWLRALGLHGELLPWLRGHLRSSRSQVCNSVRSRLANRPKVVFQVGAHSCGSTKHVVGFMDSPFICAECKYPRLRKAELCPTHRACPMCPPVLVH